MGAADHAGPHLHFPDALLRHVDDSTKASRSFELLGAAIGSDDFIHQHCVERAARAGDLLDALWEVPDPQVGLP